MADNNDVRNEPELDKEVYEIIQAAGWMFPVTPHEVEQVEKELAKNPIELPEILSHPGTVFDMIQNSPDTYARRSIQFPGSSF